MQRFIVAIIAIIAITALLAVGLGDFLIQSACNPNHPCMTTPTELREGTILLFGSVPIAVLSCLLALTHWALRGRVAEVGNSGALGMGAIVGLTLVGGGMLVNQNVRLPDGAIIVLAFFFGCPIVNIVLVATCALPPLFYAYQYLRVVRQAGAGKRG